MRVVIVNCVWDPDESTADGILNRFTTLTGWAEALQRSGVASVVVFQRFHSDADVARGNPLFPSRRRWSAAPQRLFHGADARHASVVAAVPAIGRRAMAIYRELRPTATCP